MVDGFAFKAEVSARGCRAQVEERSGCLFVHTLTGDGKADLCSLVPQIEKIARGLGYDRWHLHVDHTTDPRVIDVYRKRLRITREYTIMEAQI